MKKYIPSQIEPKWQQKWTEEKQFSPNLSKAEKPYYSLMMFPYPSAEGLHVGNMYAFTGSDIYSRFKRMQGYDVLEPIGLDGFGIHSENYAMKVNQHPFELSKVTEKRFYNQLRIIGNSFDWDRTVETYKPNYYKWTQWLFLKMYEKGLAYRKKASVNWCPSCLTVLADEQVISGECERCASKVEKKLLEQWFFRITDYAERLLGNLKDLDWSEKVKIAQEQWIGKSEGMEIEFPLKDSQESISGASNSSAVIKVFTVYPETIFGVTYMVLAPENPLVEQLTTKDQEKAVKEYIEKSKKKSELERTSLDKEKTGVFTGSYCINPVNGKEVPIWLADYVIASYGTGAVMGVPSSDHRDFDFAKKYNLEIIRVIGKTADDQSKVETAKDVLEAGWIVNSTQFNGLETPHPAKEKIMDWMEEKGFGKRHINYHLRDWLISRQRYWGPPIPIIYCDKCGTVPVPEKDLPVELPFVEKFRPIGTGKSPLAFVEEFINVKCPKCNGDAKRETDVSDTFLDSAWYFLRYPSTDIENNAFDADRTKKWLPVDMYIGGAEHSVLHLLYSRFMTMVLKDLGYLDFEEPFSKFRAHGLIIKDGAKMSKSKGNVVNPDDYIKEYGADSLRTYLMFVGPFADGGDFRDSSMSGIYRFLQRVWGLQQKVGQSADKAETLTTDSLKIMHRTIKKVTEDLGELKYNTAIASLMEWLNHLSKKEEISKEEYQNYILLLAPIAPHITEELWAALGNKSSVHKHSQPEFDSKYLEDAQVSIAVQINGKVRDTILIEKDILNDSNQVEKVALASEKVRKFVEGESVKKVVYIPGKIISFVVSS